MADRSAVFCSELVRLRVLSLSVTDRPQVSWKIVIKHLTNCTINIGINEICFLSKID